MVQLTAQINIGQYIFYFAEQITVESSWQFLSDTATITLPYRLISQGKLSNWKNGDVRQAIKVGNAVEIRLGYNYDNKLVFKGYVTSISPEIPVVIKCQDAMWQLKQTNHTKSFRAVSLAELLKFIMPSDFKYRPTGTINLGKFIINNTSTYDVLAYLKEKYGIVSYFKNNELVVGFPYFDKPTRIPISFQREVASSTGLVFHTAEDVKILVRAISIQPNGDKVQVEIGDKEGEIHTTHLPVGLSKADCETQGKEQMKRMRFDGFRGDITIFGSPVVEHSDVIELKDSDFPERDGNYRVDTVRIEWGGNGFRRILSLGHLAV